MRRFPALTELGISENPLASLDLSKNTQLTSLTICNTNLSKLDLSKNIRLKELYCQENRLDKLNIGNCTRLQVLDCGRNRLKKIDLRNALKLEKLYCFLNPLSSLDISRNVSLRTLECHGTSLSKLDTRNCSLLSTLIYDKGLDPLVWNDMAYFTTIYDGEIPYEELGDDYIRLEDGTYSWYLYGTEGEGKMHADSIFKKEREMPFELQGDTLIFHGKVSLLNEEQHVYRNVDREFSRLKCIGFGTSVRVWDWGIVHYLDFNECSPNAVWIKVEDGVITDLSAQK